MSDNELTPFLHIQVLLNMEKVIIDSGLWTTIYLIKSSSIYVFITMNHQKLLLITIHELASLLTSSLTSLSTSLLTGLLPIKWPLFMTLHCTGCLNIFHEKTKLINQFPCTAHGYLCIANGQFMVKSLNQLAKFMVNTLPWPGYSPAY